MARDVVILCNGAEEPADVSRSGSAVRSMDYRQGVTCDSRVRIKVPQFTARLLHLPPRLLDLVEIASYVYAADRLYTRGTQRQVEFSGWSRRFRFVIKVADHAFWSSPEIQQDLSRLLEFLAGDESYSFEFQPGFHRHPTNIFDYDEHRDLIQSPNGDVALFSGGIDSTAGVMDLLSTSDRNVFLVSHKSGSSAISRTQTKLVAALRERFPNRVNHVEFESGLSDLNRAPEETQRARFFLYASIGIAVAQACGQDRLLVYENGVTSIHLRKRQDQLNSRSTRTTHPVTINGLRCLFSKILGTRAELGTPFAWMTKTDVVKRLAERGGADLFSSTVSCGRTIKKGNETHCGACSQCVDRRVAAYAAGLFEQDDEGLYSFDFTRNPIPDEEGEARTVINDFFFQAAEFKNSTPDGFAEDRLAEVSDVALGLPNDDPESVLERTYELCHRHGIQAFEGYEAMRQLHSDPSRRRDSKSIFAMVEGGSHLRPPHEVVAGWLGDVLSQGLRISFQRQRPNHENVLNDEIEALLTTARVRSDREFPHIPFATAQTIADHSLDGCGVLVEAKYPRKSRRLPLTVEEMSADLIRYDLPALILFVVYDPDSLVKVESKFIDDFERKGRCMVRVVR